MDYDKITLTELKNGYHYDSTQDHYICNYCEQHFPAKQIFPVGSQFYTAEYAVNNHISTEHKGTLYQLVSSHAKYNTLTQNQRELILLFASGQSDKEIAKKLDIAESTVRRQRFTFREKAKQAKYYLAIYEQAFEHKGTLENTIIPIHSHASYVDDRYLITEQERNHILETTFCSFEPLVLKNFSAKEKKKVVILTKIAEQFESGRSYTEKEVNQILRPIYEDYTTVRRYLIMYGVMERAKDGSSYWMTE